MNLFSKDDKLYELQEIWNRLDPEKAIVASHYDLAKETDHSAEEWKASGCRSGTDHSYSALPDKCSARPHNGPHSAPYE